MAEFGISTFYEPILISEGPLPPIRVAFITLTILFGIIAAFHVSYHLYLLFRQSTKWTKTGIWPVLPFFSAYLCHLIIHTAHFADNIARPVEYFEPKWLYQRYILSTMEITFFFNIPMTLYGAVRMVKFLGGYFLEGETLHVDLSNQMETNGNSMNSKLRQMRDKMYLYSSMSILTLMHYVVEPPQSYTFPVNFTIAGEGISALILALMITRFSRMCIDHAEDQAIEFSRLILHSQSVNDTNNEEYLHERTQPIETSARVGQVRCRTPLPKETD